MRYAKTIIVVSAALLAGTSALAMNAPDRPMVHIASTAAALMARLDKMRDEETSKGCPAGGASSAACADSENRIKSAHDETRDAIDALRARPESERAGAIESVKKFSGRPELAPRYRSTVDNPYRDDNSPIETYVDDRDNEYWVEPASGRIVQMGPLSGRRQAASKTGPRERKSVAELRKIATEFAASQIPDFAARRASLHPLEDNKDREVYFFRWDDFSLPASESRMPPFIQVALNADGTIASYTDTLNP